MKIAEIALAPHRSNLIRVRLSSRPTLKGLIFKSRILILVGSGSNQLLFPLQ